MSCIVCCSAFEDQQIGGLHRRNQFARTSILFQFQKCFKAEGKSENCRNIVKVCVRSQTKGGCDESNVKINYFNVEKYLKKYVKVDKYVEIKKTIKRERESNVKINYSNVQNYVKKYVRVVKYVKIKVSNTYDVIRNLPNNYNKSADQRY